MSNRRRHRRRSKWAHVNTPSGLRARSAKADAKREAIAARIVEPYRPPEPLTLWQSITIDLYVPARCSGARCEQHAAVINGECIGLLSATQIAAKLRGMVRKRPSVELQEEIMREEWRDALRSHLDSLV